MPIGKINSSEMYGITRCHSQNGKHYFWRVTINRRGLLLYKSFYDLKWGGTEKALAAAKQHRDAIIRLIPPLTKREYAQNLKANNVSGHVGVHRIEYKSGTSWTARIQLPSGKAVTRSFPEAVHGARARDMAIQARLDMLQLLDKESTFTFSPGAIAAETTTDAISVPISPRTLCIRIRRAGGAGAHARDRFSVSVSDGVRPPIPRFFNTEKRGVGEAFRQAMQAALDSITLLCGEQMAQLFERDYVQKCRRLPAKGIRARIPFFPSDNAP